MSWQPPIEAYKPRRQQPERVLQGNVVRFLQAALPHDCEWSHIGHGQKTSAAMGARLKAMGLRSGVPDILIVSPQFGHIWIELKAPKGRASEDQVRWLNVLNAAPYSHGFLCRSLEAVESALLRVGVPLRARVAA